MDWKQICCLNTKYRALMGPRTIIWERRAQNGCCVNAAQITQLGQNIPWKPHSTSN